MFGPLRAMKRLTRKVDFLVSSSKYQDNMFKCLSYPNQQTHQLAKTNQALQTLSSQPNIKTTWQLLTI